MFDYFQRLLTYSRMEVLQSQINNLNLSNPPASFLSPLDNADTTPVTSDQAVIRIPANDNDKAKLVNTSWKRAVEGVKQPAAGVTKGE